MNRLLNVLMAACIVTIGGLLLLEWRDSRPKYSFDQTHVVLTDIPTGVPRPIEYRIHNLTGKPMRIVGAEST